MLYETRGPIYSQTYIGGELPFRLRPFNVPETPYKLNCTAGQLNRRIYKNALPDAQAIINAQIIYPLGAMGLARKDLQGLGQDQTTSDPVGALLKMLTEHPVILCLLYMSGAILGMYMQKQGLGIFKTKF